MLDIELYGGKRGLLEHARARALHAVGAYHAASVIEWEAVRRLVFICAGNICRSPYACARAQSLGIPAASFGLSAAAGAPANAAAMRNAIARGINLSAHRSARADPSSFADGDLVLVFEPAHMASMRRSAGGRPSVTLLGIWSRPLRPHIQDPYGRSDRYFQQCFSIIDSNVASVAKKMTRSGARNHGEKVGLDACGSCAGDD